MINSQTIKVCICNPVNDPEIIFKFATHGITESPPPTMRRASFLVARTAGGARVPKCRKQTTRTYSPATDTDCRDLCLLRPKSRDIPAIPYIRDRKGTPKSFATKISPNFLVRFASKPLFYWGFLPSNHSENSLVLFVRFFGCGVLCWLLTLSKTTERGAVHTSVWTGRPRVGVTGIPASGHLVSQDCPAQKLYLYPWGRLDYICNSKTNKV